ncbi:MAG: hypothetical protein U1F07_16285 [Rubrivivax sp.]
MSDPLPNPPELPWWRVRMLWLVLGGPIAVVVASFATLVIALTHPDPVIEAKQDASTAVRPAMQVRNQAATPQR